MDINCLYWPSGFFSLGRPSSWFQCWTSCHAAYTRIAIIYKNWTNLCKTIFEHWRVAGKIIFNSLYNDTIILKYHNYNRDAKRNWKEKSKNWKDVKKKWWDHNNIMLEEITGHRYLSNAVFNLVSIKILK